MLEQRTIRRIVDAALEEDSPAGDISSQTLIPTAAVATATLNAREPGVFAGAEVYQIAMTTLDHTVEVDLKVGDGDRFATGDVLAEVRGPARAVLQAERVGLNLLQRMCGIATLTAQYVAAVEQHPVRIADTRKTAPLLRPLDKHAVVCGGGRNHRYSLSDAVMAKDNHLALMNNITDDLIAARDALPHTMMIEVEVTSVEQIEPVLASGAVGVIMLDNFSPDQLRAGVAAVAGRAVIEASGGITLDTVTDIAATGVDVISVGAITHSARALDLGFDISVTAVDS